MKEDVAYKLGQQHGTEDRLVIIPKLRPPRNFSRVEQKFYLEGYMAAQIRKTRYNNG